MFGLTVKERNQLVEELLKEVDAPVTDSYLRYLINSSINSITRQLNFLLPESMVKWFIRNRKHLPSGSIEDFKNVVVGIINKRYDIIYLDEAAEAKVVKRILDLVKT